MTSYVTRILHVRFATPLDLSDFLTSETMGVMALMSRNAGSGENGDFGEILSVNLTIFMQITLTEMDLTCWRIWRIWRFLCKLHVGEFEDHQRWA